MAKQTKQTKQADFLCIRERNQITLPGDALTAVAASVGDFLECTLTEEGYILLAPARLVRVNSPEAEEADRKAEKDIVAGRFETFHSAKAFEERLLKKKTSAQKQGALQDTVPGGLIEIQNVLRAAKGNVSIAARKLGVPPRVLKLTMKTLHHIGTKKG